MWIKRRLNVDNVEKSVECHYFSRFNVNSFVDKKIPGVNILLVQNTLKRKVSHYSAKTVHSSTNSSNLVFATLFSFVISKTFSWS